MIASTLPDRSINVFEILLSNPQYDVIRGGSLQGGSAPNSAFPCLRKSDTCHTGEPRLLADHPRDVCHSVLTRAGVCDLSRCQRMRVRYGRLVPTWSALLPGMGPLGELESRAFWLLEFVACSAMSYVAGPDCSLSSSRQPILGRRSRQTGYSLMNSWHCTVTIWIVNDNLPSPV